MANIKGKQLMVSVAGDDFDQTIAYATSHTFQIGSNLDDVSTKDDNDLYINQEVTSQNWSVTTENLIAKSLDDEGTPTYDTLLYYMKKQTKMQVYFDTVPGAMGKERTGTDWVSSYGNNAEHTDLWHGYAYITSLELNAGNRENASYTATFTGVGAPISYATTKLNAGATETSETSEEVVTASAKKSKKSETTETTETAES